MTKADLLERLEPMSMSTETEMIDEKNLMVWTCKIVVEGSELPPGFDSPPRMAAEAAIAEAGFVVLMNASGWGGSLTKADKEYLAEANRQEVYYAGVMDTPEDVVH